MLLCGYVAATWDAMTDVFGDPFHVAGNPDPIFSVRARWELADGTCVVDDNDDGPLSRITCWMIRGRGESAFQQVAGIIAEHARFGGIIRPDSQTNLPTVTITAS